MFCKQTLDLIQQTREHRGSEMIVMKEDIFYEFHSPLEMGGMAYMQDNQGKQPLRSADRGREGGRREMWVGESMEVFHEKE